MINSSYPLVLLGEHNYYTSSPQLALQALPHHWDIAIALCISKHSKFYNQIPGISAVFFFLITY